VPRRRRIETTGSLHGGSRFSVLLNADETAALAAIQAKTGESKAAVVKRLILAAAD